MSAHVSHAPGMTAHTAGAMSESSAGTTSVSTTGAASKTSAGAASVPAAGTAVMSSRTWHNVFLHSLLNLCFYYINVFSKIMKNM